MRKNKGITLIALIVTIIILLILAGVTIVQLTESGLFNKAKLAEQKSENAQNKEELTLGDYENKINEYVSTSRFTSTNKEILWNTTDAGIREVELADYNKNINDYDFIIVYYNMNGLTINLIFDNIETMQLGDNYDAGSYYHNTYILLDKENNKITMTCNTNNSSGWNSSNVYLTRIVGINI